MRLSSQKAVEQYETRQFETKRQTTYHKSAAAGGEKPKSAKPAIPPELLEGDETSGSGPAGPGRRYALGPKPPEYAETGEAGELPEALWDQAFAARARDPRWLYAHWDLTRDQLKEYNSLSADRHLVVRVYKDEIRGQPASEIHVHPESRNWFINVPQGRAKYLAQLGYYTGKANGRPSLPPTPR